MINFILSLIAALYTAEAQITVYEDDTYIATSIVRFEDDSALTKTIHGCIGECDEETPADPIYAYTYTRTAYGTCTIINHQSNISTTVQAGSDSYCVYDVTMGSKYTVTTLDDNNVMQSATFTVTQPDQEVSPLDR